MKFLSFGGKSGEPDQESAHDDVLGRNRVFYVSDLGLVTQWYLAKRCEEECYRSTRYTRPLSFILVEPLEEAKSGTVQRQLSAWVREELRVTDIPARLSAGRYAVLLIETNLEQAAIIVGRLGASVRNVRIGLSSFPEDGASLEELITAATAAFDESTEEAA